MYESGIQHRGYRYAKPTAKHFCILKAVRVVSGMNSCMVLAENGFNQEMCVMMRTVIDCLSQIDFIIAGIDKGNLADRQQKIVDSFFDDFRRNSPKDFGKSTIRQEKIHKEIERYFNRDGIAPMFSVSEKLSNVYRNFSNYVHARYPEVMDMYGGHIGRFHMTGMLGTPKDAESYEIIATFTDSVALTLAKMIDEFDMAEDIRRVPEIAHWIKK